MFFLWDLHTCKAPKHSDMADILFVIAIGFFGMNEFSPLALS